MAVSIYVPKQELKMIRTLVDSPIDERWRFSLLGKLSEDHFHLEPARLALTRIRKLSGESQQLPTWEDLICDPVLDDDVRQAIKDEKPKRYKTLKKAQSSYNTLEKYRRIRQLFYSCKSTITALTESSIDIDTLVKDHAESLTKVHTRDANIEEQTLTLGDGAKGVASFLDQVLNSPAEKMLKTGFAQHDKINGGLPTSGVMILAATTSGGKSVTSMNLGYNLYMLNDVDVVRVSLEMMKEQEFKRFMSRVSGVPFWKIKQNKLSDREKKKIKQSIMSFHEDPHHQDPWIGKRKFKRKGKFSTITPATGMTMENLLNMLKPFGFGVTIIDYIGLLEGMSGDRQWMNLSDAVYHAKNYTKATGSLCIILCQLSEDDKLRYSKGMKEHADVMWQWNYSTPELRATKQLPIEVTKARDGELMEFPLNEDFECMRVTSPEGADSVDPRQQADRSDSGGESGRRAFG